MGGGGYNWVMVISLVYTPPFLAVEREGKQQWQNCPSPSHAACDEAHSGSVLQGKGSWINEGAVFAPQPASYKPATVQPIDLSVYRWPVGSYIRESVDSLCRDGADAQYMQYLSKSRITSPKHVNSLFKHPGFLFECPCDQQVAKSHAEDR